MNHSQRHSADPADEPGPAAADNSGETAREVEQAVDAAVDLSQEAAELVQRLQAERDAAVAARTRALADFCNFQRRALESEATAHKAGAAQVAKSIIPVVESFDRALAQDKLRADQLLAGLRLLRKELLRALQTNGVEVIQPAPGDEFDPVRHEAMFYQPAEGFPPDTIVSVLQNGYAMGDVILRPAKVALAASPKPAEGQDAEDADILWEPGEPDETD